jgi:hypothetical protein
VAADLRGDLLGTKADLALWAGILAGPFAWASDLGISYALVQWTCGSRHTSVLHLVTLATLVLIAAGATVSWRVLSATPAAAAGADPDMGGFFDRPRFMAVLGLLTSALFAVLVVASAVPRWVLDACQQ